ncbi:MAG: helix-turn-helix domain-containing protein [Deltaproteobacteria bacterium]|nr:helix-turn-helix domain-containing protein [Deltaproteobacteria bacterium]MBW1979541.1 helix-turn-helix domain-containing protein [Deltaproteobacteria bacterium]
MEQRVEQRKKEMQLSDPYLDLRKLSGYSSLSVSTLRGYIKKGTLMYYKVKGKILVRKSHFDEWMKRFEVNRKEDLDDLVDDVISRVKH